MSQLRDAILAACDSEDPRRDRSYLGGPQPRRAHSPDYLRRLLRRVLENVDGELTANEMINELDGMEPE